MQDMAGPAFLHGDRADPRVERPGLERGGHGEAQLLARHVVEVRLEEQRALPGTHSRPVGTLADDDLGAVGQVLHLTGASAEARRGHRHVGEGTERGGERGEQGGTGGRRELNPHVTSVRRDALEQTDRRRRRIGQPAVRAAHHSHSRRHRGGAHLVDAEHLERSGRPDDVDDGVVPADLVEVHLVDRPTMQGGFDRGQLVEDRLGTRRHARRKGGLLNEGGDHPVGAHHHVVAPDDGTGAGDAAPDAVFEFQVPAGERKPFEQRADLVDVGARVNERPQRHVARDAGEAVEPRQCGGTRIRRRHGSSRAIAQAAP